MTLHPLALETSPRAMRARKSLDDALRVMADHGLTPACSDAPQHWELGTRKLPGHQRPRDVAQRDRERRDLARRLCDGCLVLAECAEWGIASRDGEAIVIGGLTPEERIALGKRVAA